jgi:hypothetical protein
MNSKLNEQESIRLITEMISEARKDLQKGRGEQFLIWGYSVAAISLLNFILCKIFGMDEPLVYLVWAMTLPVYVVTRIIEGKRKKESMISNRINDILSSVWRAYIPTVCILYVAICITSISLDKHEIFMLFTPLVLSVNGLAIFVSGRILDFKMFVYGGIIFWAGSIICALISFLFGMGDFSFLVFSICTILGMAVPGHVINAKSNRDVC